LVMRAQLFCLEGWAACRAWALCVLLLSQRTARTAGALQRRVSATS